MFGDRFNDLDYNGRLVMATAAIERVVSHNRLLEICDAHSHDLSLLLARLVKQGLLESDGRSRGTVYFLPGDHLPTPEQVFIGPAFPIPQFANIGSSTEHSEVTRMFGGDLRTFIARGGRLRRSRKTRDTSPDAPVVDDLSFLDVSFRDILEGLAEEPPPREAQF